MHISIWTVSMASSMQAALHINPNYAKNLETFKNFGYENIESLFQCYEHDDCRKFRIKELCPEDSANPSWERSTLPTDPAIEWTKSKSIRKLGSSAMHVKNA